MKKKRKYYSAYDDDDNDDGKQIKYSIGRFMRKVMCDIHDRLNKDTRNDFFSVGHKEIYAVM